MVERTIRISTGSMVRVVLWALALAFLLYIRDIVGILALALVLTAAVTPGLRWLDRVGIPRPFGVTAVLVTLVATVVATVVAVAPELARQLRELDTDLPNLLDRFRTVLSALGVPVPSGFGAELSESVGTLSEWVRQFGGTVADAAAGVGRGVISGLAVIILTVYLTLSRDGLRGLYRPFVPERALPFAAQLEHRVERRLGRWLRGQLAVSLAIVVLGYLGFLLLGLRYPLVLALIGGFTAFVPAVSFVLAGIPAVLAAGGASPALTVGTAAFVVVLHQLATIVVLPRVVGPGVHLNPGVVLALLLAGAALSGVVGLLLAVPVAAVAAATLQTLRET